MAGEADWASARDEMEVARRDFINATRRDVVDAKTPVDHVPVARPPLSEIRQLFGPLPVALLLTQQCRAGRTTKPEAPAHAAHRVIDRLTRYSRTGCQRHWQAYEQPQSGGRGGSVAAALGCRR
jgi:hypothetical protein